MEIIFIALAIVWLFITFKELASHHDDWLVALISWSVFGILPLVAIWGVYKLAIYFL
jgi:hypothetical protein